jgi:hypothetical protein
MKEDEMGRACSTDEMRMRTIFWLEKLKGRDHAEDLDVDGKIISERILGKFGGSVWSGFIWLRIGTSSRLW